MRTVIKVRVVLDQAELAWRVAASPSMEATPFRSRVAQDVWASRYRAVDRAGVPEPTIEATWQRIARGLASVEADDAAGWQARFEAALRGFRFLPGGRVQAGAGTQGAGTLFSCFVLPSPVDSLDGILASLREAAVTLHAGGGIGCDFSSLRPCGDAADDRAALASGPVSFMRLWDTLCATLLETSPRRGAMMATLACDHPDIEQFVDAKRTAGALSHFNLSVLVTDAFMDAVAANAPWPLTFPSVRSLPPGAPTAPRVRREVNARALWSRIVDAAHACAEPGVLFVDRVNAGNNLHYCEDIHATNPCGEIPLPAHGACDLGSLNLTQFVREPFGASASIDWDGLSEIVPVAVRMLDNVYDLSTFPLDAQRACARRSRRLGLGITGLADALVMLGLRYGEPASIEVAAEIMMTITHAAYRASIALARERGAFPAFERAPYLDAPFVRALPADIRDGIARDGIRNSHLTAIAPTGSISLLANLVSSGLEPIVAPTYTRRVRRADGTIAPVAVVDYAVSVYRERMGEARLPPALVRALEVPPETQLAMQAALQVHVDSSISKTVSVPRDIDPARFERLFHLAYALDLKGFTTWRPNTVTGSVLVDVADDTCCAVAAPAAA